MQNSIQKSEHPNDTRSSPSPFRGSIRYIKSLSFSGQKRIHNDSQDKELHSSLPQDLSLSPRSFTPTTSKSSRSKSNSLNSSGNSKLDRNSSPFTSIGRFSRKRSKTPQARLVSDVNNSVFVTSINTPQDLQQSQQQRQPGKDLLLTPLAPISLTHSDRRPLPPNGSVTERYALRSQNHVRERISPRKPSLSVIERPSDLSFMEALEELDETDILEERRYSITESARLPFSPPRIRREAIGVTGTSVAVAMGLSDVEIPEPPPLPSDALSQKMSLIFERSQFLQQRIIHSRTVRAREVLVQPLLSGELVMFDLDDVIEVTSTKPFQHRVGTAYITNYRFILNGRNFYWAIPLGAIDKIITIYEKLPLKESETFGFSIICRYPYIVRLFSFTRTKMAVFQKNLADQSFTQHLSQMFAFRHFESLITTESRDHSHLCWGYNITPDYERLGLDKEDNGYLITNLNKNYKLCKTYPASFVLPAQCSSKFLQAVASFRSRSRIPAITWRHPTNNKVIVRCAQPLCGIIGNRSQDDEKMMELFAEKSVNNQVYLFDCRSQVNAYANKLKGAGTEAKFAYRCCQLIFLKIENIHVMRASQKKLFNAILRGGDPNESGWLEHISLLLTGALRVSQLLLNGSSIVVHCSDGWDRTPQLVGLAEIMLDPYYRTIKGFEMLVDKEWLSFGHMFHKRTGYGDKTSRKKESSQKSPIFLQFIDSVWQLYRQFPSEFEFNEMFLIYLLYHSYSCLFGNFLCDSEKERNSFALFTSTCSLWHSVEKNANLFLNPQYQPSTQSDINTHSCNLLAAKTEKQDLLLWTNYYYSNGHFPWDFLPIEPV